MQSNLFFPALFAPLFAVVLCDEAQAAQTGSLRGHVDDDMGLPVPGATIVLTGPSIAGQMIVTTDDEGNFRFVSVPVGSHSLQISRSGFTPMKMKITIRLDETAFAPIVLRVSGEAEIVIEETLPVIDTTKSSFSTELTAASLADLPTTRDFDQATRMLPGVYGRIDTQDGGNSGGDPSVRGEGSYGNNAFLDGASIRDTATKTSGQDVNFDIISDIQVYTDGAPAEFGESTGMIINAITKDGGDEHFGSAGYYLTTMASFEPQYEILGEMINKSTYLDHELSLTAGGPVVKEKLWYMLNLEGNYSTAKDIGWDETTEPYSTYGMSGFGKFTWFATPDLSLSYQFKGSYGLFPNILLATVYEPEAQQIQEDSDWTHMLTGRWRPDVGTEVELKGIFTRTDINVEPMSGDEDTPQIYDLDTGVYSGNADSFDYNIRTRLGASASVARLLDGSTGHHRIKGGASYHVTTDSRELIFTGPGEGVTYQAMPSAGYPCQAADYSDCAGYTVYSEVGALAHEGQVLGLYLQDDWQPVDNLTMNVGMRVDKESLYANAGNLVYDNWLPAPRLGVAWDLTGDNRTKASINAGRYYDIAGNSFADWGDTRSAATYYEYAANGAGGYDLVWVQDPAQDPLIYDENLRPYHNDKIAVGLEREIFPLFSLGIRGILSQTVDIPEDVDTDLDYWYITNPEAKRRDYRAVELTATKKLEGGWQILASYTLSESLGHMPGQFELSTGGQTGSDGNNVGVYLDDVSDMDVREELMDAGQGWLLDGLAGLGTTSDDAGYYGYLPYHSFHQLKVNGSYSFKWGTTVGLIYEFDSGHAWQKKGYVWLYGDYYAFPEGRGSRFMPAVHFVDLHLEQAIDLKNNRELAIGVDIFNLFDFQQPINYMENDVATFGEVAYRQSPRSIQASLHYEY